MKVGVWSPLQAATDGGGSVFERELVEAIRALRGGGGFEFDLGYVPPVYREAPAPAGPEGAPPAPEGGESDPDLVYFPSAFGAPVDIPYIATVWDLQYRRQPFFPEVSAGGEWEAREARHVSFLRRAAAVIVPNEVGKREVCRYFSLEEENVHCVPHPTPAGALDAADEFAASPPPRPERAPKGRFLLYPAQFWAHKNHILVLEALSLLRSRGVKVDLVCTGEDKGNLGYLREVCARLRLEPHVHFPGFIATDELYALYHHCEMLVYPSLFGPENLPPLEAFAFRRPVVVADYAGAREQLGEHAAICDRHRPEVWADEIERTLETDLTGRVDAAEAFARTRNVDAFLRAVLEVLEKLARNRRTWSNSRPVERLKDGPGLAGSLRKWLG